MSRISERNTAPSQRVVIVGAGGHGREIYGVLCAAEITCAGFVDDVEPDPGILDRINASHLGPIARFAKVPANAEYSIGVGSGAIRQKIEHLLRFKTAADPIVHPMAAIDLDVRMQPGTTIFAQATVTTNIDLGRHCHIGRGAAIGHDSVLGNYVTVMPLASVSGSVRIGDRATIGAGAVVRQGQTIGPDAMVGAGAVVVNDVPPGAIVVGNPAKPIGRTHC